VNSSLGHSLQERSTQRLRATISPKRVLVVDDNRDAATMLSILVRTLGHTTMTAFDGDSAIALAQEFKPEVVLLDLVMPDADGNDIALGIRSQPGLEECRIFIVSAHYSAEDRMRSLRTGCEEHYGKPLDPSILVGILGDLSKQER
jgi:DNA-binding response OmpR family regulator